MSKKKKKTKNNVKYRQVKDNIEIEERVVDKSDKEVEIITNKKNKIKSVKVTEPKNTLLKDNKKLIDKNTICLFVQFFFSLLTLVMLVVFLFNRNMIYLLQIFLGCTMLITGYNNYTLYRKRFMTLVYFVVGLLLIALAIMVLLGV